ncbi:uncharacterized protein YhaN [Neorhizobium galegae]|uniref:ATP-binding protein n=1 Tax=Neorhizobium galegae TaxID=399 RepID=UPI001AE21B86|nr:AAA family ATPase [Neorhizobium galegae]MBP2551161.1 uncharacterized protein YhaN [Neorhizobium galegae]
MRLRRLDLTRYGKFTDHTIDFGAASAGSPDLHIVYGLNEAGKSTAFSGYLDLLFGIPERSSYNFLHAYNAMQVGGVLEFDGGDHELVRLKQRTNALIDGRGQPVNEILLSSALGGLTREAYRTMFSLDERSLRDGGAAIVESRGDLGEMLFSASSGLADVSRVLTTATDEAHQFHRKRARNTQLSEMKQQLAGLKGERDRVDTYASTYAGLVAAKAQAEKAYEETLAELSSARAEQARLSSLMRARPLARDLARLEAQLAAYGDLPRPPREWASLLADLMRDETRLQTQKAGLEALVDRLQADIAVIAVDEDVLAAASAIAALGAGRARYLTAEDDLPKRRLAFVEQEAALGAILKSLGQQDHKDASALVLPAALGAKLRDLIEARSGIAARIETAERELERARRGVEEITAQQQQGDLPAVEAGPLSRLEAVVSRLQKGEKQTLLAIETRTTEQMEADLLRMMGRLQPPIHNIGALRETILPGHRQLDRWRVEADEINRRLQRHTERRAELGARLGELQARSKALSGGDVFDDETAAESRKSRDAAWQAHLQALDLPSAQAFHERLVLDDRLAETRLGHASELAELRQLRQEEQVAQASLAREAAGAGTAERDLQALIRTVEEAAPRLIAGVKQPDIYSLLSLLEAFADKLTECLLAADALDKAKLRRQAVEAELQDEVAELMLALADLGWAADKEAPLRQMVNQAADRLAKARDRVQQQANLVARLVELQQDVNERQRVLEAASRSDGAWQKAWGEALSATWFAGETEPAAVRAILDVLADLPAVLKERDQLAHRIDLMERDSRVFATDVAKLALQTNLDASDLPVLAQADQLVRRVTEAERHAAQKAAKQADLHAARDELQDLERQIEDYEARKATLTSFFSVDTLAEVSQRLEQAAERDRMERRMAELREQLLAEMKVATVTEAEQLLQQTDAEETARAAEEVSGRIDNLAERSRIVFADLTRAKDRVDAVGGDDAVAKIEAERTTLLLQIEELAVGYLRLRAGTLAAESALSLYREKHRSSMMKRASQAFAQITRGDYSGLAAQPDKDREILIGVARDGASKLSDAMSTGTRYQLYLALRLAGYEEFAAVRPSVPFVADDIMETFDEFRAEEVFRLFGQMAGLGQVIYLTHHRHLCEIAQSVVPGVKIHAL